MPKMNRTAFSDVIPDLWQAAQNNFAKHGRLYNHVVALDAMGRQLRFVEAPPGQEDVMRAHGAIPVVGRWTDHLVMVREALREHKAVAAVLIGEAWATSGEYGVETIRMGIWPSEHPMRDEIVFAVGFWPREFVSAGFRARIERDERGENARLVKEERIDDEQVLMLGSWLEESLPQPR